MAGLENIELKPARQKSASHGSSGDIGLKKELSLLNGCTVIIGCIIGSGIFITPNGVLQAAGTSGLSIIMWFLCGIISMVGSYCYAELGMCITRSGADYAYIMSAFGPMAAFVRLWVEIIVIRPVLIAIVSKTFALYIVKPFFGDCSGQPQSATICIAVLGVLVLTAVNCLTVRLTARVQDVCTVAKIAALILIIITGIVTLCLGNTQLIMKLFTDPWAPVEGVSPPSFGGAAIALYEGLFAYNGWNFLNYIVEELKEPEKNLPRAIIISMLTCMAIYILTVLSYMTTLTPEEMAGSREVGLLFASRHYGVFWWIIPVFVSLSCFGTVNGILMTTSRLTFVGAREGHLPLLLNMVSVRRATPIPSCLVVGGLSILYLVLPLDITRMISYSSILIWLAVGISVLGLIVLRYTQPNLPRPLKIWIGIPIFYVGFTVAITLVACNHSPTDALIGFGLLLTALPVYLMFIAKKKSASDELIIAAGGTVPKKSTAMTRLIANMSIAAQKLLGIVPEKKEL